jgi:hypothetical protein
MKPSTSYIPFHKIPNFYPFLANITCFLNQTICFQGWRVIWANFITGLSTKVRSNWRERQKLIPHMMFVFSLLDSFLYCNLVFCSTDSFLKAIQTNTSFSANDSFAKDSFSTLGQHRYASVSLSSQTSLILSAPFMTFSSSNHYQNWYDSTPSIQILTHSFGVRGFEFWISPFRVRFDFNVFMIF